MKTTLAAGAATLSFPFVGNVLGANDRINVACIGVNVWRSFPFSAIVLLAGFTSVPTEVLDAARAASEVQPSRQGCSGGMKMA